jgi:hypothetical protein
MLDIRQPTVPRATSRARRLAQLRTRAASGAAAVFIAAWLALYVPAAREEASAGTSATAAQSAAAADVSAGATLDSSQDDSTFVEQSAPLTTGQS